MECGKIQENLSGYLDDILDAQTRNLVEDHIAVCTECRDIYESMKEMVTEIEALEPVSAPDDFLKKVHERIEERRGFPGPREVLSTLFRVRIPLQFATAVAMGILLFFIIDTQEPVKEIGGRYMETVQVENEKVYEKIKTETEVKEPVKKAPLPAASAKFKAQPEDLKDNVLMKETAPKTLFEMKAPRSPALKEKPESGVVPGKGTPLIATEKESKPLEITLLMGKVNHGLYKGDMERERTGAARKASRQGLDEKKRQTGHIVSGTRASKTHTAETYGGISSDGMPSGKSLSSDRPREKRLPVSAAGEMDQEEKDDLGLIPSLPGVLPALKELIVSAEGSVLSTETGMEGETRSLLAEIPLRRYGFFYNNLKKLAPVKKPVPTVQPESGDTIRVRILFKNHP